MSTKTFRRVILTTNQTHPNGALVVPDKVVYAFRKELLPKKPTSVDLVRPKGFSGMVKYFSRKSALFYGPTVITGAISTPFLLSNFPTPSAFEEVSILVGLMGLLATGFYTTARGIISIAEGDMSYAPLPPTEKYLERKEREQDAVILPFNAWDEVFNQASNEKK